LLEKQFASLAFNKKIVYCYVQLSRRYSILSLCYHLPPNSFPITGTLVSGFPCLAVFWLDPAVTLAPFILAAFTLAEPSHRSKHEHFISRYISPMLDAKNKHIVRRTSNIYTTCDDLFHNDNGSIGRASKDI